jgi:hypothetical protein
MERNCLNLRSVFSADYILFEFTMNIVSLKDNLNWIDDIKDSIWPCVTAV